MSRLTTVVWIDDPDGDLAFEARDPDRTRKISVIAHDCCRLPAPGQRVVNQIHSQIDIGALLRRLENRHEWPGRAIRKQQRKSAVTHGDRSSNSMPPLVGAADRGSARSDRPR